MTSANLENTPVNDAPTFIVGDGIVDVDAEPSFGHSIALQPDGKIVVATPGPGLLRLNPDGSLDTSFADIEPGVSFRLINDRTTSVAIQADGKILVAGTAGSNPDYDFAIVRYNADGSLDPTFGTNGEVTTPVGPDYDVARAIAVQPDGKILVVGQTRSPSPGSEHELALVRYNTDGSLDATFDNDGIVTADFGPGHDRGWAVGVQADGRIVVAGSNGSNGLTVARYNADGSLDASFGTSGMVITPDVLAGNYAVNLELQADGKIIVAGSDVVRYNTDGSLDSGFGVDGIAEGPPFFEGHGLALHPDGGILLSGTSGTFLTGPALTVAKFRPDGSLDPDFGDGGIVVEDTGGLLEARNIVVQPDGGILIAGGRDPGSNPNEPVVVRLTPDGSLDPTFDAANSLGITVAFTEGGPPVVLAPGASIFDAELSPADSFDGASLRLERSGGANPDDVFHGYLGVGPLTESANLVVAGDVIGTVTQNSGGTLLLTFEAGATQERVDQAMRWIRYENISDDPPASVDVDWVFNDGNSGAQGTGGALTAEGTVTVAIAPVNDAPIVTEPPAIDPEPGGEIVVTGFSVDDADDTNLTVTLSASSTLTLSQVAGLAFTDGDGTADANMTFSGTLADINAAMDGMSLSPGGEDGFTYIVDDGTDQAVGAWPGDIAVNGAPKLLFSYGVVTTDFGGDDRSFTIALQPDGKVLLAGYTYNGLDRDFALARYNPDGSLDATFDGDGAVITNVGTSDDRIYSMTLQPDGKILAAGVSHNGSDYDFALTRYNADGSLDTSFAGDGRLTTAISPNDDSARSVLVQADGKIVVAGYSYTDFSHTEFTLTRYNPDATLDTSFGSDGIVVTPGAHNGWSASLQPDGKILLAGSADDDFAVARYNTDGSLDTSFDGDGVATTNITSDEFGGESGDRALAIIVQPDGKILVAGSAFVSGTSGAAGLVRYNIDGSLDASFGDSGIVVSENAPGGGEIGWSISLQPDGKIVLVGSQYQSATTGRDIWVARFNADGSLDSSFGDGGSVSTEIGPSPSFNSLEYGPSWDYGVSVAVQPDGKIVVGGRTDNNETVRSDFALLRYNADGSLDTTFGVNTSRGATFFAEDGPAELLDSNITVFDPELSPADSFAGASLTIARDGGANAEDVFGASGNLAALTEGGDLTLSSVVIGTVTQASGGTLVLTFNSDATQARVDEALQSITYSNASDDPPTSVDILWTFDDGNSGAQGAGGALAAEGTVTVYIKPNDDFGVAFDDAFTLPEDAVLNGATSVFADNGSGADTDPDSPLFVTAVNGDAANVGNQIVLASGALVTLNADGTLSYDPNGAFDALPAPNSGASNIESTDSLTYSIPGGSTATVTITVTGVDSDDILEGTAGNDILIGGVGADLLNGGEGNDTASYETSDGRVVINLGMNYAAGGHAQGDSFVSIENVIGSAFNDRIAGDDGPNVLYGGAGNDYLRGAAGNDTLNGGSGFDTASYEGSNARVVINLGMSYAASGHAEGDSLVSIEGVIGSAFNDRIAGSAEANVLSGGEGDDYLRGEAGGDLLDGGGGIDTACYSTSNARVVINLGMNYAAGGHAQGDSFISIENVVGSGGNDRIAGSAEANVLSGGGGNDYLRGEGGDDLLFGGEGDDLFAFAAGDGDDEIGDFVVGADHLVLNGIIINTTEELDGNGDGIMDTLVTFSSGDTVLLAGVTGVSDPGELIA